MKKQLDPSRIVNVVVTPCTAKKAEIRRPEFNAAGRLLKRPEIRDNDYCITSKELAHWLQEEGIDFNDLPDLPFDDILGKGYRRRRNLRQYRRCDGSCAALCL